MAETTNPQRLETLRSVSLFQGLSDASLERVLELATEFDAPAGVVLAEAKLPGSGMFVIEEGTVHVEAGHAHVELGPGDFFGEMSLLNPDSMRTGRVQAKTPVRCLAIARKEFRELLLAEPTIALHMLETLAARLTEANA